MHSTPHRAWRALVLDPDPDHAEALASLLQSDGFTTVPATDAEAALRLVQAHDPDVIITALESRWIAPEAFAKRARVLTNAGLIALTTGLEPYDAELTAAYDLVLPKASDPRVVLSEARRLAQRPG